MWCDIPSQAVLSSLTRQVDFSKFDSPVPVFLNTGRYKDRERHEQRSAGFSPSLCVCVWAVRTICPPRCVCACVYIYIYSILQLSAHITTYEPARLVSSLGTAGRAAVQTHAQSNAAHTQAAHTTNCLTCPCVAELRSRADLKNNSRNFSHAWTGTLRDKLWHERVNKIS